MHNYKGIAYRSRSATAFIDMSAAPGVATTRPMQATPAQDEVKQQYMPWSPWGKNNLFPQEMVNDIETCGILNSIIDGKARFAINEGIVPAIVKRDPKTGQRTIVDYVEDPEITQFLEMNNDFFQCMGWLKDLMGLGNAGVQFMLNGERNKIAAFKRIDASEMRYQKENKMGIIENLYLSANWNKVQSPKDDRVITLPLLDFNNPVEDLRNKAARGIVEHAMTFRYSGWGKHYYSTPLWYAAYKWVKIAQGVPEMKAALFQNTMRLKYHVIIYPNYWEGAFPGEWDNFTPEHKEQKRNELFDEIDNYLVGAENAHKSFFSDGMYDSVNGKQVQNIEIKAVEDNTKQGEYLPDSAAANSEIAFSMLWNNALTGGNQASGLYEQSQGGSNVRESFLMQVIIHEYERRLISRVMAVPKYFNGWAEKHPGLDFVIPATILTTTDTGGSTKPATMGGAKQPDNGSNPNNSGN